MNSALLLIDLQQDFLDRPGLEPGTAQIVTATAELLSEARRRGLPVVHVRTRVAADGSDAMPHWREQGYFACVAGSPGELSPAALAPVDNEPVLFKRFFSGFENPQLEIELRQRGIDTLIMAGLYLHGCVRSTALDAYARGFRVLIAEDAVASTEPMHAASTRAWLDGRAARFVSAAGLLNIVAGNDQSLAEGDSRAVAVIDGAEEFAAANEPALIHHNPAQISDIVSVTAAAGKYSVGRAARSCSAAQQAWAGHDLAARRQWLHRWKGVLAGRSTTLAELIVNEVGKPIADARLEVERSLTLIAACADSAADEERISEHLAVRHCPVGVVGMITPWNNPLAIPIGKLAPALVFGNGVVWKPSPHAALMARAVVETLTEAGFPAGLVNLVFGAAETAHHMMREPAIDLITLTGATAAGDAARVLCSHADKALQAELGGNNAAIVLADADLDAVMPDLVQSAFNFSGQRCTAIRRFIVAQSICAEFERRLRDAVLDLRIGHPAEQTTQIGPLISEQRLRSVRTGIADAIAAGARLVCGREIPDALTHGCWLAPTVLTNVDAHADIVRHESFGPVAVIQEASDLQHAIALANAVPHGLVAGLIGGSAAEQSQFIAAIHAGIVKLGAGPVPVSPSAPFRGWKASGSGPPEHGRWNREFYAKPQAIYS